MENSEIENNYIKENINAEFNSMKKTNKTNKSIFSNQGQKAKEGKYHRRHLDNLYDTT